MKVGVIGYGTMGRMLAYISVVRGYGDCNRTAGIRDGNGF